MKKLMTKIISVAAAVITAAAITAGASADYIFSLDDSSLVEEIVADTKDINGTEITLEKELGDADTDSGITLRLALFNEYLDAEFWNNPDIKVSVDVKLETEGANVIGYLVGFNTSWKWIDPSDAVTLKAGEWVTITETGTHFYENGFSEGPSRILFQLRSNWGQPGQGKVKISLRNFTISDSAGAAVPVTVEAGDAGETVENNNAVNSTVEAAAPEQTAPTTTASTAATTIQTAAAPATSIDYNQYTPVTPDAGKSTAMVIIIIIVVVAVVVVGIIVGYIIYKKKKYY